MERIIHSPRACALALPLAVAAHFGYAQEADLESDDAWLDSLLGIEESWDAPVDAAPEPPAELLHSLQAWQSDGSIAVGAGWRDNPLYAPSGGEGAAFALTEFDYFLMRPGLGESLELLAVAYGEIKYYDGVEGLSDENLFAVRGSAAKDFANGWRPSAALGAVSSRQAFDASEDELEVDVAVVEMSRPSVELGLARAFDRLGELAFKAERGWIGYSQDGQDYEETLLELSYGKRLDERWRVGLAWQQRYEDYDQRRARLAGGAYEDAPLLEIDADRISGELTYATREGWLRRAETRFVYGWEDDRAGDYYERGRWSVRQAVALFVAGWSVEAAASYEVADYAARLAIAEPGETRKDGGVKASLTFERGLRERFVAFARLEFADKESNERIYDYQSSAVAVGLRLDGPAAD